MRIFVVGGTGVIGRRIVQKLVENDHKVYVLSRSEEKSKWILEQGAEPLKGSMFDLEQMNSFTANMDGIVNMATSIPKKMKTKPKDWKETCKIRDEGKMVLIQACLDNHCKFLVQESFLMVYGDRQGEWVDESTPILKPVPLAYNLKAGFHKILNNAVSGEELIKKANHDNNLPSIVLRYGVFYAQDASTTIDMIRMIKKHRFPIIGSGNSFTNPIHVDDAASATIKAVENYQRVVGKTFNICDDEPVKIGDFFRYVASATGSKKPRRLPLFLAKLAVDPYILNVIFSSVRCKNTLAKDLLDWNLQYPTYREGISEIANNFEFNRQEIVNITH